MGGADPRSRERRPIGLFGWALRILGGVATLAVLVFVSLLAGVYLFGYLPQQRAAAAFARLSGSARRLAIYDAFVTQIDKHYYDQSFSGFDWPKLRQEWRVKAAAEPDDLGLYNDVFVQVTQRFPTSHVAVIAPPRPSWRPNGTVSPNPVSAANTLCSERDAGWQLVPVRRGRGFVFGVGEVWPNSPAARAGVTPGWAVTLGQFSKSKGAGRFKGAFVRLTSDQMHGFEATGVLPVSHLAPARVEFQYPCRGTVAPFETRRLPDGALYIRFDEFQAPVLREVEAALKTAGERGAVLDLRFNSGGYTKLGANLLFPQSTPIYFERGATGRRPISTDASTWRYRGPLVVLIGPASASAAEITAAALQHAHRALIIGRRTNGSVLEARLFPLPDGGTVQIPVDDVEMLDGQRLEGKGVAPDIEVFPTLAEVRAGIDPALVRAEQALSNGGVAHR